MDNIQIENFIYQDGDVSLSKAATLCCMVDNDLDESFVEMLNGFGIRAVITRAGGSGDNLKNKVLRNTFGAAENSGLVSVSLKNRYAITKLVEGILQSVEGPLISISGGGLKISLAVRNYDMAIAIFGNIGLPGLDIDFEVSASRILYNCLED